MVSRSVNKNKIFQNMLQKKEMKGGVAIRQTTVFLGFEPFGFGFPFMQYPSCWSSVQLSFFLQFQISCAPY
jgi:hypothetical protein